MARYVMAVQTPRSADDAFDYMADITRFAEWDPGVARAVHVRGAGLGASYDLTVRTVGSTVMRYEITAWDRPRRVALEARTRWVTSVDEIRVAPAPDGRGSVVTYAAELTLAGWLGRSGRADALLARAFRRIGDRAAAGLRAALGGFAVAP